jgi:hypothetical protein
MEQRRRIALVLGVLALVAVAAPHPSADIRIETHAAPDIVPTRVQAALDVGLMSVSVLVTWTEGSLR